MEKKQTSCHPVQETNEGTLDPVKETKKYRNSKHNRPEQELGSGESGTFMQYLNIFLDIPRSANTGARG
jgi:hypothetical protein